MIAPVGRADVRQFGETLAGLLGLAPDSGHDDVLAEILADRLRETGQPTPGAYLAALACGPAAEVRALAARLTVGETYFFRHADQFRAFAEVALPERLGVRSGERRLDILSAGCSSGEEAYSLALGAAQAIPDFEAWTVDVVGVDVNPAAIARAREARYGEWSLRATPADARARYFREHGRDLSLRDPWKKRVRFEERNLLAESPEFWRPGRFDVVFCRNVLMYFTPEAARAVVARLARSIAPHGWLFLGHAETLRGLSRDFHLCHSHEAFFYQLKAGAPASVAAAPREGPEWAPPASWPAGESWVDAIGHAAERIYSLTARLPGPLAANGPSRPAAPADLGLVLALFREERYGEALAALRTLPGWEADPDATLLAAALLTNQGETAGARRACAAVLSLDECSAGAHYLLALCHEHAGDLGAAIREDESAAYLDPAFAMPHLHLGLLARRAGDGPAARRELEQALALLAGEDASRILLFGGGFGRDALAALCRSELAACQGEP